MAKQSLTQQLEAAHVSYQKLVAETESLRNEVTLLQGKLVNRSGVVTGARTTYVSTFKPSDEQLSRRAAMAAARTAAMAGGRVVKAAL